VSQGTKADRDARVIANEHVRPPAAGHAPPARQHAVEVTGAAESGAVDPRLVAARKGEAESTMRDPVDPGPRLRHRGIRPRDRAASVTPAAAKTPFGSQLATAAGTRPWRATDSPNAPRP